MVTSALLLGLALAAEPAPDRSVIWPEYEKARAEAGRDADAHYRLALWCERHGLGPERLKHLALAVRLDPAHAPARGLMGLVEFAEKWRRPADVEKQVREDEELAGKRAEYNRRRAVIEQTAEAQWRLASWCENQGLADEARAHLSMVVALDPKREAAWRKLAHKKVGDRWMTPAEGEALAAEREARRKADREWKPRIARWRQHLKGRDSARAAEAEAALAGLSDPRAVSAIWATFAGGDANDQARAVRVLGQIDSREASRALASLAVFSESTEVRRSAAETLRRRDSREFADLLIGLIRTPIRYEVRPVGGPGTPGSLTIEGPDRTLRRVYTSAPPPQLAPGDRVEVGPDGLAVARRDLGLVGSPEFHARSLVGQAPPPEHRSPYLNYFEPFPHDPAASIAAMGAGTPAAGVFERLASTLFSDPANAYRFGSPMQQAAQREIDLGRPLVDSTTISLVHRNQLEIPIGRMALEAHKSAVFAQHQLEADVASLDAYNGSIGEWNERALAVLRPVSGRDLGADRDAWRGWFIDQLGYAFRSPEPNATIVEEIPSGYVPLPPEVSLVSTVVGYQRQSCFAAGTLVRTLDGPRPIEALEVGDRVLTLDTKSGALGYNPVTLVHRNPPSPTFAVRLAGDSIVASPFHRFWKVGQGWVMARDLKAGDVLRTLDGPAAVESVEEGPPQPVFNLDVAGHHDFFAGQVAALVHDNTLPDLRLVPFDAAPALAAGSKAGR